jgi:hypothetical protein
VIDRHGIIEWMATWDGQVTGQDQQSRVNYQ